MLSKYKGCLTLTVIMISVFCLGCLSATGYFKFVFLKKEKDKYLEFLQEDGQVFVGVVVPNDLFTGDEKENSIRARAFLNQSEQNLYRYVRTERNPLGFNYSVIIFEALPANQRLTE